MAKWFSRHEAYFVAGGRRTGEQRGVRRQNAKLGMGRWGAATRVGVHAPFNMYGGDRGGGAGDAVGYQWACVLDEN